MVQYGDRLGSFSAEEVSEAFGKGRLIDEICDLVLLSILFDINLSQFLS